MNCAYCARPILLTPFFEHYCSVECWSKHKAERRRKPKSPIPKEWKKYGA